MVRSGGKPQGLPVFYLTGLSTRRLRIAKLTVGDLIPFQIETAMNLSLQFGFNNPHDEALQALTLQKALLETITHLAELPFETRHCIIPLSLFAASCADRAAEVLNTTEVLP